MNNQQRFVWSSVRRISFQILGVKGLKLRMLTRMVLNCHLLSLAMTLTLKVIENPVHKYTKGKEVVVISIEEKSNAYNFVIVIRTSCYFSAFLSTVVACGYSVIN